MFTLLAKIVLLSVGSPRQTVLIPFLSFVQHCQTISSDIVNYRIHVCWKVMTGKTREQKRQCDDTDDCLCWTLVYKTIIILTPKPDI